MQFNSVKLPDKPIVFVEKALSGVSQQALLKLA